MSKPLGTANVFAYLILIFGIGISVQAQQTPSIYRIPAGTRIRLRMQGDIGSKFSSVNDTFLTCIALPVEIRGVTMLPIGTLVEGRVLKVTPAGLGRRDGSFDIRMETLRFSDEVDRSIEGVPVGKFQGKRPDRLVPVFGGAAIGAAVGLIVGRGAGTLIGAGLGSAIGAGAAYSRKGKDVRLKEDDVFEIVLKKEVVLPVLDY
jgi:hypothetical protein